MMLVPVVALLASSNMVTSGYVQQASASVSLVQPSDAYLAYQRGSPTPSSGSIEYSSFVQIADADVAYAVPVLSIPASFAEGATTTASSVLATNLTAFVVERDSVVYGRLAVGTGQADAGAILAQTLGLRIGDNVTVDALSTSQRMTVVGILNSTDQSDTSLILPLAASWSLWPQTAGSLSYVEFSTGGAPVPASVSGSLQVAREEGIDQIASAFDSQTTSLLSNWTYVLLGLAAAAAVAASSRVVTEVSQEFNTIRALGARLSAARALVFYQLAIIAGAAVVIGVSMGLVATSVLGTVLQAVEGLPLFPGVDPSQLAFVGAVSFVFILGAGASSLAWLPRRIVRTGEAR